jgi:hypothetical protein
MMDIQKNGDRRRSVNADRVRHEPTDAAFRAKPRKEYKRERIRPDMLPDDPDDMNEMFETRNNLK